MKRKFLGIAAVLTCLTCAFALIACTGGGENGRGENGSQTEPVEGKYFYWENGAVTTKFIELKSGGEAVVDHVFEGAFGSIFYGTYTLTGENISMTITRGNLGDFPDGGSNTLTGTVKDGVMRLYADYDGDPATNDGVTAYFAKEGKTPPGGGEEEHPGDDPAVGTPGKYFACIDGELNLSYFIELKEDFGLTAVNGGQSVSGSYRLDGNRITLIQTVDGVDRLYETTLLNGSMTVEGVTFYQQNARPPYRAEAGIYYLLENGAQNKNIYIELGEYGFASMDAGGIAKPQTGTFVLSNGNISLTFEIMSGQYITLSGTLSGGRIVLTSGGAEMCFVTPAGTVTGTYYYYDNGIYDKNAYISLNADGTLRFANGDGGVFSGSYTVEGRIIRYSIDFGTETRQYESPLADGVLTFFDQGRTVFLCKEGKFPPPAEDPNTDNPPPVEIDPSAVPGRYYWWNEGKPEISVFWDLKDDMTFEAHSRADVMTGAYLLDGINITVAVIELNGVPVENGECLSGTVGGGNLYFPRHGGFRYCKEGVTPPLI